MNQIEKQHQKSEPCPFEARVRPLLREEFADSFDPQTNKFIVREFASEEVSTDSLNRIKHAVKLRMSRFYPILIQILSPVYVTRFLKDYLKLYPPEKFVTANLGSGTHRYKNVIAVDGSGFPNVDIVCDLADLPFRDNSLDSIISIAVLEHVPNPRQHVSEFLRVLKPGGSLLCFIPFMQPFHASPHDFQRFTRSGMEILFAEFEIESVRPGAGPTSSLVWVLQEWLAMFFSFGSIRLYRLLIPFMWILSPLKLLDIIMVRHPASHVLASGFVLSARKSPESTAPKI